MTTATAATTYSIDKAHSDVAFDVRHLLGRVRGSFADFDGTIAFDPADPTEATVSVTIQAESVNTNQKDRDTHLRSEDFFAVEQFPTISFRSTSVVNHGDGEFTLHGDLTIKDVTRPVELKGEYLGAAQTPWGETRIGFAAETEVNRRDWGLEWNVALDSGGVLVGEKVKLAIDAEWIAQ